MIFHLIIFLLLRSVFSGLRGVRYDFLYNECSNNNFLPNPTSSNVLGNFQRISSSDQCSCLNSNGIREGVQLQSTNTIAQFQKLLTDSFAVEFWFIPNLDQNDVVILSLGTSNKYCPSSLEISITHNPVRTDYGKSINVFGANF